MNRRDFIKTSGFGIATSLGVCGCGGGSGRHAVDAEATLSTLDITVGAPPRQVTAYTRLQRMQGESLLTLAAPSLQPRVERIRTRRALAALVHITDLHVVDVGTPGRLGFMRQYEWLLPPETPAPQKYQFIGSFRANEAMSSHVLTTMVQRINALKKGPITHRALDCTVSTGDNADSRGLHELDTYLAALAGGMVHPDATGRGYQGLQSARTDIPPAIYVGFWHPDAPPAGYPQDFWKTRWGYPHYPHLLQAAMRPYVSEGLCMPWYSGFGNHDGIDLGIYGHHSGPQRYMEHFATGDRLPVGLDIRSADALGAFVSALENLPPDASLDPFIAQTLTVPVTPASSRIPFSRRAFVERHLQLSSRAGPQGHGYSSQNLADDALHFSFQLAPGVRGIMLDTTCMLGGDEGWLPRVQVKWLQEELAALHARYLDAQGREIVTGNTDQLCVIFSHHSSESMHNAGGVGFVDGGKPGTIERRNPALHYPEDYINGSDLLALLHRYPNVIAWVNGHTHFNKITLHQSTRHARQHDFWEINTAAHIDFPQQARIIEIADNRDGTLSIFSVLLDHSDPGSVPAAGSDCSALDTHELAAIALELSANDRMARAAADRRGRPVDRNVELLLPHPWHG